MKTKENMQKTTTEIESHLEENSEKITECEKEAFMEGYRYAIKVLEDGLVKVKE